MIIVRRVVAAVAIIGAFAVIPLTSAVVSDSNAARVVTVQGGQGDWPFAR